MDLAVVPLAAGSNEPDQSPQIALFQRVALSRVGVRGNVLVGGYATNEGQGPRCDCSAEGASVGLTATDERMMNDANSTSGQPTCPTCGATRSSTAVPYQEATDAFAVYTCASCGAQFESWSTDSTALGGAVGPDPVTD